MYLEALRDLWFWTALRGACLEMHREEESKRYGKKKKKVRSMEGKTKERKSEGKIN